MKFIAFASAALVSAATLTGAASAAGLVPGSDHYTEAAADRAAQSVVLAAPAAVPGHVSETRSFGYPAASAGVAVPGSDSAIRARDTAAAESVMRSAPRAEFTATPRVGGILIPGSDSF